MNHPLSGKLVGVTGANGFLGKHVIYALMKAKARIFTNPSDCSLTEHLNAEEFVLSVPEVDLVIHLAGWNGGIAFNLANKADIFYENTVMALNVIKSCADWSVKKVVSVVASCAYPQQEWEDMGYGDFYCGEKELMCEVDFLDGPPHPSVEAHAYAKRNLQLASKFYHDQYGLSAVCVCPTTLFGPGDSTDPERTKVLMAVVKKVVDAKRAKAESITFWGTGNAMREFLYVEDAARLILDAATHYDDSSTPLNLGSGHELRIRELVARVVDMVGYTGTISWDSSKPDGQLRKRLEVTKMARTIPNIVISDFDESLRKTIDWYQGEVANVIS